MSYAAAIDQLNAMVPELHSKPGQPRRKFSLNEIGVLLEALGNPQRSFPAVLIAGTNGKGSTAATLASILTASGLRTGLYTSPHLSKINERIGIDRCDISDEAFSRSFFRVQSTAEQLVKDGRLPQMPSFFEVLTAQSFLHFAESKVEFAVLEVGMGGRLDATNIVDPLLSIIADISLDHTEWLGSTLGAIAKEKAGILHSGGTLIALSQGAEIDPVFAQAVEEKKARRVDASIYLPPAGADPSGPYAVPALGQSLVVDSLLIGAHQRRNLALAIAAAVELSDKEEFPITVASIEKGIRETRWPGRLERMAIGKVDWILDVAHNPGGAQALCDGLKGLLHPGKPKILVFSCLRDKPAAKIARILFPLFDRILLAPIRSPRATKLEDLQAVAQQVGVTPLIAPSVEAALRQADELAQGGVAVVSGSLYLVGEARPILLNLLEVHP
jgi:dihydrofolate synthase/folylpolyglutamate synthase